MHKSVSDDTATEAVVWAAAGRIGKTHNREELERICGYLVTYVVPGRRDAGLIPLTLVLQSSRNWFQTAGDLRAARQAVGEWQALEVPARLKIAIQQVLDENAPEYQAASFFGQYEGETAGPYLATAEVAAACEHDTAQETWWSQAEAASSGNAEACSYGDTDGNGGECRDVSQTTYEYASSPDRPGVSPGLHSVYDQSSAAYDGYAAAVDASRGGEVLDADVAVAEAVVVEDGLVALEVAAEWPAQPLDSTWSCGQCTFTNAASEAFCEMCMGHASLSPSYASVTTDSGAAANEAARQATELSVAAGHAPPYAEGVGSPTRPPPAPATVSSPSGAPWTVVTSPASGAYAPSAPEFDPYDGDQGAEVGEVGIDGSPAPGERLCEAPGAPVGAVDFLALAFQHKTAVDGSMAEKAAAKAHRTRQEEAAGFV